MDKLRKFNEDIYNRSLKIDDVENLSCPNLVSSKKFLEHIRPNPILYLGQETNCWVNDNRKCIVDLEEIENAYDHFMINRGTSTKSPFWQFIKMSTNIKYKDIYKNIVWCNTLLMGKRYSSGTPEVSKELASLSLENLLFLYEYFKPSVIITVTGNRNPYYDITTKFLKEINSSLVGNWPIFNDPLIEDAEKDIYWTFHPRFLRLNKGMQREVSGRIYKKIKTKI